MTENDNLGIPTPFKLSSCSFDPLSYFFCWRRDFPVENLANEASTRKTWWQYQRIFNYRLSRASLTNENIFQILAARWRIFYNPIRARADKVEKYTLACLALHNYSRITDNATNVLFGFADSFDSSGKLKQGGWRALNVDNRGLLPISRVKASCYREYAHVWEIR